MLGQEEGHKTKIILASASPRRKQVFETMGLEFEVIAPVDCREEHQGDPCSMVIRNSISKAKNVFGGQGSRKIEISPGKKDFRFLISSFDTIVRVGNRILGKPSGPEEAYEYISLLSGRVHRVISGVCILDSSTGKYKCSSDTTQVWFRDLTGGQISNYILRGDVMDKAGAYNINGPGSVLVEKIKGCFFNVAGVPVFEYI
ncbi:MAG: septum formation protein Maf, partial [Actinomycetota bacterium]